MSTKRYTMALAAIMALVACNGAAQQTVETRTRQLNDGERALYVDMTSGSPEVCGEWFGGGDPWTSNYTDEALLFIPVHGLPDGAEVVSVRVRWYQSASNHDLAMYVEARSLQASQTLDVKYISQHGTAVVDEVVDINRVLGPGEAIRLVFETTGGTSRNRVYAAEVIYRPPAAE